MNCIDYIIVISYAVIAPVKAKNMARCAKRNKAPMCSTSNSSDKK